MLKAIDLKKQYKPKNGQIVNALDGVNIVFGETGMVFILGKSGSGKSTLLNVLGGLDKYDSGEVIVKGKSSKDFSQADFDSYRNTFIGFIFQEYNILQEFSVEKNIGLALELQGKKADKEAINALIEQVDLKGYGKRKPNTLSGGQKQRVAIARALVKNPEIIMADEPTGALDSKTGAQVLDTLKKLSKEKLVIIVSHDREFAEYYGDRIIELSDGKIISDQYKHEVEPIKSNGLEIVDDKILTIKKGMKLDNSQLDEINSFLLKQNDDVIVSVDGAANKEFKKFAKINDEGQKETFKETAKDDIKLKDYDGNVKLIRSKLPMRDSVKMGASGLKTKRFRLVITILLSALAFGMFGLADTMASYNKVDNTVKSLQDSNIDYAAFEKMKKTYYDKNKPEKYYLNETMFNDDDFKMLKDKFNIDFLGVYNIGNYSGSTTIENLYSSSDTNKVNCNYFVGGTEGTQDQITKYGSLSGTYPTNFNEVIITEYIADSFVKLGYRPIDKSEKVTINQANDMIGKDLRLNGKTYTITGILDTHFDYNRYSSLNVETNVTDLSKMMLQNELYNLQRTSVHTLLFLKEGYYKKYKESKFINTNNGGININVEPTDGNKEFNFYVNGIGKFEDFKDEIVFLDSSKTTLQNNELVIDVNNLNNIRLDLTNTFFNVNDESVYKPNIGEFYYRGFVDSFKDYCMVNNKYTDLLEFYETLNATIRYYDLCNNDQMLSEKTGTKWNPLYKDSFESCVSEDKREIVKSEFEDFIAEFREKTGSLTNQFYFDILAQTTMNTKFMSAYNTHTFDTDYQFDNYKWDIINSVVNGHIWLNGDKYVVNDSDISLVKEIADIFVKSVISYMKYDSVDIKINDYYSDDNIKETYNIVGLRYVFDDSGNDQKQHIILPNNDRIYDMVKDEAGNYQLMIGKITDKSTSALKEMVKFNYDESNDIVYQLKNSVMNSVDSVNSFIETAAKIFLYVGIGFAVFASLLLLNFITISISYKKREIGILRAIGARGMDVFKIFFSEAFIIAIINFVLAFVGCFVACFFINRMFRNNYGFLITVLHIGIRQLLLMLAVSFVVAFISSFIPVYLTARKKPIDAIRSAE